MDKYNPDNFGLFKRDLLSNLQRQENSVKFFDRTNRYANKMEICSTTLFESPRNGEHSQVYLDNRSTLR